MSPELGTHMSIVHASVTENSFTFLPRIHFTMSHKTASHVKLPTYAISSVLKLTMLDMKLSLIIMDLMALQSTSGSPRSKQIASRESFTNGGGLGRARISAKCCFLMPFTAVFQRVGREECAN